MRYFCPRLKFIQFMVRTSDFEKELFLYKTEGKSLAKNINMRRELEAQETTSESVQEYLKMDKS